MLPCCSMRTHAMSHNTLHQHAMGCKQACKRCCSLAPPQHLVQGLSASDICHLLRRGGCTARQTSSQSTLRSHARDAVPFEINHLEEGRRVFCRTCCSVLCVLELLANAALVLRTPCVSCSTCSRVALKRQFNGSACGCAIVWHDQHLEDACNLLSGLACDACGDISLFRQRPQQTCMFVKQHDLSNKCGSSRSRSQPRAEKIRLPYRWSPSRSPSSTCPPQTRE